MAQGLPYDSDEGRAWAAAITALMTGHAYATSARTAARMGPFAGYHENSEPMLERAAHAPGRGGQDRRGARSSGTALGRPGSLGQRRRARRGHGVRNSQASVLAPTGTIGLLMDCDTTGVEPDLGLVKTKKLVGGGTMSIVNQTIPRALTRLGLRARAGRGHRRLHQREQVDRGRPAPGPPSTCPCSPAPWATTPSITPAMSG